MEQQQKAPPEIKNAAQFLRGALKARVGALNGKRLDYFKGLSRIYRVSDAWNHRLHRQIRDKSTAFTRISEGQGRSPSTG